MSFANKNVLITGGTDGIGKALVLECLQRGASHIVILDVVELKCPEAVVSDKITFFKTDVSDVEQVRRAFQDAIALLGHLDIVIANAGICNEFEPNRVVQVNLIGVINTNYTAIEFMCKSKGGRGGLVVNTASVFGLDSVHIAPAYVAAKHGVVGLTRSLGEEFYFNKHGIKFITFCPGFTETSLNVLAIHDPSCLQLICSKMGTQTAEVVAESMATIAGGDVKNGSVWMITNGITTEVEMKTYWKQF